MNPSRLAERDAAPTPAALDLREGERLELDRPGGVWRIERGSVEYFRCNDRPGSPYGRRVRLFALEAGEIAVGNLPGLRQDYRIDVVAAEPSRLAFVPFGQVFQDPDGLAGVERWAQRVCELLEDPLAAPRVHAAPAETPLVLSVGDKFSVSPGSVAWLEMKAGRLVPLGDDPEPWTPESPLLPASGHIWFVAQEATQVVARRGDSCDRAGLAAGVVALLNLGLRRLERLEDAAVANEVHEVERAQAQAKRSAAAPSRLIIRVLAPTRVEAATGEPWAAALDVLGRELGVNFVAPKRGGSSVIEEQLQAVAQASGVRHRRVRLSPRWWEEDLGPLLGFLRPAAGPGSSTPVALVRGGFFQPGYRIFFPGVAPRRLTDADAEALHRDAFMFFTPFPAGVRGPVQLGRFALAGIAGDLGWMFSLSIVVALLGLLGPVALRNIVDAAIPDGNRGLLWEMAACLASASFGSACFSMAQGIVTLRGNVRLTLRLQAALIDRLLNLPASFFRNFSSGDLLNRSMVVTQIATKIGAGGLKAIFAGFTAGLNMVLLCYWSWRLAVIPLAIAVVAAGVTFIVSWRIRREALEQARRGGKLFGFLVQVVGGITKFRVAGAADLALEQWARRYATQLGAAGRILRLSAASQLCTAGYSTIGTILVYYSIMKLMGLGEAPPTGAALSMGEFLGFNAAFGAFLGGVSSFSLAVVDIMDSFAQRSLCQPILETPPEANEAKADPGRLQGEVEVRDVSFRYHRDGPYVLRGVSLSVRPGALVAIVGPSGCGKSTLFRLLLGFEAPEAGAICYDQQDLSGLNALLVRRQIGTVLQSATIGPGSLLECISGAQPLTTAEVWAAVRDAGLEADVQAMPMGLHTLVNEGGHNLSGGQRQRLMIARALARHPKLLLLDEATSALDNRTQHIVNDSLQRRQVTRLVIAHRLSTVEKADRIYVLDHGRVVQQGAYAELAAAPGLFQTMMRRQAL